MENLDALSEKELGDLIVRRLGWCVRRPLRGHSTLGHVHCQYMEQFVNTEDGERRKEILFHNHPTNSDELLRLMARFCIDVTHGANYVNKLSVNTQRYDARHTMTRRAILLGVLNKLEKHNDRH